MSAFGGSGRSTSRTTFGARLLGVGAAAVLLSDVGLAAAGGSPGAGGDGAHGSHGETSAAAAAAYAAKLRRVTARVDAVVSPVQKVLDVTINPGVNGLIASHDAVGHSDAARQLAAPQRMLTRLHPPAQDATQHQKLVKALAALRTSVAGLHSKGPVPTNVENMGSAAIVNVEDDWDTAVKASFSKLHAAVPRPLDRKRYAGLRPDRTQWIYQVDRDCLAAAHTAAPTAHLLDGTPSADAVERFNSLWQQALGRLGHDLTHLRAPRGEAALPPSLARGLHTFMATSEIFGRFNTDIRAGNPSAIPGLQASLDAALTEQRTVGHEMQHYGATVCGAIVINWARKHPTTTKPGHLSA